MNHSKSQHYLVTGGAGFIGSAIAHRLLADHQQVTIADNLSTGLISNLPDGAEFIEMDLGDREQTNRLRDLDIDAVFHLAAQSSGALSFEDPVHDFHTNVWATFNLLQICREKAIPRFIFSSSTTTYGEPDNLPVDEKHPQKPKSYYAAGKISSEAYIRFFQTQGVRTTILRLPNVYGPGQNLANADQGMISIYLAYYLKGEPVVVKGNLERFRDFIYIDDVVDAWMQVKDAPDTFGKTFNVATGRKTTVRQVINGLNSAFDTPDHPLVVEDGTPGDQSGIVCDPTALAKTTGWRYKVDIEKGLKLTVDKERGK